MKSLDLLTATLSRQPIVRPVGRVKAVSNGVVRVTGLSSVAAIGHRVKFVHGVGEVVGIAEDLVTVFPDGALGAVGVDQPVQHLGGFRLFPDESWLGRVLDGDGLPLDDLPLVDGAKAASLHISPPSATDRREMGGRIETGHVVLNTMLPFARGQRMGVFAGSGVGKSSLMGALARDMEADVNVIALIGERGREVNQFLRGVLGKKGLEKSVVVAATSDRPALTRRRAAYVAMAVAEYFRDQGKHVMLMVDSLTRLAEAHREIAVAAGESTTTRGYPPSTTSMLAGLAERAGPGTDCQGDITALMTVLVAGSDMEEPLADTVRGLLDGHIVLSREIAERGRFPAIDVLQSVSRAFPDVASENENALIGEIRRLLATYEASEIMVRSGLYQPGGNPDLDLSVTLYPELDALFGRRTTDGIDACFAELAACLTDSLQSGQRLQQAQGD